MNRRIVVIIMLVVFVAVLIVFAEYSKFAETAESFNGTADSEIYDRTFNNTYMNETGDIVELEWDGNSWTEGGDSLFKTRNHTGYDNFNYSFVVTEPKIIIDCKVARADCVICYNELILDGEHGPIRFNLTKECEQYE